MTNSAIPAADTGLPRVTTRRPHKPTKAQINAFMCKLLDPLPDTEIEDKDMARLVRRAESEKRKREDEIWAVGATAVWCAQAVVNLMMVHGAAHRRFPDRFPPVGADETRRADLAYLQEIDRQFRIPARNVTEFRWKENHLRVTMNIKGYNTDERKKLFAEDQARLGLSLLRKR